MEISFIHTQILVHVHVNKTNWTSLIGQNFGNWIFQPFSTIFQFCGRGPIFPVLDLVRAILSCACVVCVCAYV